MNKFKKALSGTLAGMIFAASCVGGFAKVADDVLGTKYEEAAEVLGGLNIMVGDKDTGSFRPDEPLKRSEFAKIAVAELGLTSVAETSDHPTKYPDVVSDHWANGYINVATDQGLVIGDDTGNFRPDDTISYAEAMTVLVRMLGHEPSALSKGSWPTGHLVVGTQIGLAKNVSSSSADDKISRGVIAQMAFNALDIKLMEQTGFGENVNYEVVDKTILVDKLDVEKVSGQITANSLTRLDGASSLADDEVQLGDEIYTVGNTRAKYMLGFYTDLYVQELANGEKEILVARMNSSRNQTLRIDAQNVESLTGSDKRVVEYWEDKDTDTKTKKATIASGAKLIYNGIAETFTNELAVPEFGSIVLLDPDKNDEYDIVFVTNYTNYVVEDTSSASYSVFDKYGKPALKLDPEDTNLSFTIRDIDGQEVAFADLKEWDVLSVTESKDKSVIDVVVSRNAVTGKVTEKSEEEVMIDGTAYKVAANYEEDINIGDEGTFYLDMENRIAAVDSTATLSGNYAYLVAAGSTGGVGGVVEFKVFDKEGNTQILTGADRIQLDDANAAEASSVLEQLKSGGSVTPQLITFNLNSDGKVIKIDRAYDGTSTGAYNRGEFTKNFTGEDVVYKSASSKLGKFNIDENTIVFDIPAGKTDPEDFAVRNKDMFVNDSQYNIEVYDMTEDMTAKVVIVTNSTGKTNVEAPIAVVDKITRVTNDRGESVEKIYLMYEGQMQSFLSDETGVFVKEDDSTPLQTGDVIQFKLNSRGEIDAIDVLFDSSDMETEFRTESEDGLETVYGKVEKKFSNSINVSVEGESSANYSLNGAVVYKYDSKKSTNKVTLAEAGEISKYDEADPQRVFIRIYKDEVKEIVIVR